MTQKNISPAQQSESLLLERTSLFCGTLSSLLYIAINIIVPTFYKGYDSASLTVSELSAIGAPTRTLWVILAALYTLLVTAFGWGVWHFTFSNRYLRISGFLILAYGAVGLIWPWAPMHQRSALAAGEKSFSDTLHLILAGITVLLMLISMGFGAASFGKSFRIYTLLTIALLLVFGILTAMEAPKVELNLPTPLAGVWERINIGLFLVWIMVLSIMLLKRLRRK